MPIQAESCKPYLSGVLFHVDTPVTAATLTEVGSALVARIEELNNTGPVNREIQEVEPDNGSLDEMQWSCIHYREHRPPAWYIEGDVLDVLHHIIVLTGAGSHFIASFSDARLRNQLVNHVNKSADGPLNALRQFGRRDINASLVANRVRTLWLSGTHRRSAVKADSKTLSGIELESAVDPLGDQTYYYSSIRSTVGSDQFPDAVIGSSPQQGRFWISPSENWASFLERTQSLLAHVSAALDSPTDQRVLPMLAQPKGNLEEVSAPYGMSLIVPEAQFPDAVVDGEQAWLQNFADSVRFELTAIDGSPNFSAVVWWHDLQLGTISYSFDTTPSGSTRLVTEVRDWADESDDGTLLKKLCQSNDLLTIYFDTGHTFSRGTFYQTSFRDPHFTSWEWVDCTDYDVGKEKPIRKNANDKSVFDPAGIGSDTDDSLFTFIARHWPNLKERGNPSGWLLCDDGSMESADFIHLDPTRGAKKLALIHVKGSDSRSSSRGVSVADYEIVVGQAVKNLRHLDREALHGKLSSNDGGVVADAVWHDGAKADRQEFLDVLNDFGSNFKVEVHIFQPRVREAAWNQARTRVLDGRPDNQTTKRMRQLDSLLQGASVNSFALGAEFFCIGDV
ncbi:MAG: hypothetical protein MPJ78_01270 [Hyphomicrobiaceae bacterium]|nr:hypothetical protein [Hyphomicrobiaceae bacterium]